MITEERLQHIIKRLTYLRVRWAELNKSLSKLIEHRDWADVNASAQTWYHANVRVNVTKREMKMIEEEVLELEKERVTLEQRLRRQNGVN